MSCGVGSVVLHGHVAQTSDCFNSQMNGKKAESFRESKTSSSQSGQLLMHTYVEAFHWSCLMAGSVVFRSSEKWCQLWLRVVTNESKKVCVYMWASALLPSPTVTLIFVPLRRLLELFSLPFFLELVLLTRLFTSATKICKCDLSLTFHT